jgi:hypothetical protein
MRDLRETNGLHHRGTESTEREEEKDYHRLHGFRDYTDSQKHKRKKKAKKHTGQEESGGAPNGCSFGLALLLFFFQPGLFTRSGRFPKRSPVPSCK